GRTLEHPGLPAHGREGHRGRPPNPDPAWDRGARLRGALYAPGAAFRRCDLRLEDAARAHERCSCSLPPRVRRLFSDRRTATLSAPVAHAPRPGQPRRGALRRGCGLAPGLDHFSSRGRRGRAHGRPLRDLVRIARFPSCPRAPAGVMALPSLVHGPLPGTDLLISGAHALDPRADIDGPIDVLERDGLNAELGATGELSCTGAELVQGQGKHLFPAFVDPHVHLRSPGQEHKEDLETGTRAAAAGGFCAVIAMPNTDPVLDDASLLRALREQAEREARVPTGFLPAITRGLQGETLTEMAELRDEGALGFTDDGKPVVSAGVLRRALRYQKLCG